MTKVVDTYKKTDFFVASMEKAGALAVEIIEEETLPDGGRRWKAKITEASRLPEFLRTADILVMINESTFHPHKKKLEFNIAPSAKSVRVTLSGTIDLLEQAQETEIVYHVDLSIGIPLFGKKTEALGLKIVGDECGKQAALLERWANA